ncbi:MAG: hypothetical protein RMJ98_10930 [Myxococcales bacterium]|nr:hypothetical protein [Polyangiaceae bacterium]MDW8249800.1 hypothetical protein [Myxococcales bacterium]
MTKKLTPAAEIDAYCTKCKLDLAHRIISLDGEKPYKVECLTCRGVHRYRSPKSAPAELRTTKTKSGQATPTSSALSGAKAVSKTPSTKALAAMEAENQRERDWERRVSGKSLQEFKPYRPSATFSVDELIHHTKFGDGFVARVIDKNKIEVMFRDGLRTLAHGYTG